MLGSLSSSTDYIFMQKLSLEFSSNSFEEEAVISGEETLDRKRKKKTTVYDMSKRFWCLLSVLI